VIRICQLCPGISCCNQPHQSLFQTRKSTSVCQTVPSQSTAYRRSPLVRDHAIREVHQSDIYNSRKYQNGRADISSLTSHRRWRSSKSPGAWHRPRIRSSGTEKVHENKHCQLGSLSSVDIRLLDGMKHDETWKREANSIGLHTL